MKPSVVAIAVLASAAALCAAATQPFRIATAKALPSKGSQRAAVAVTGNVSRLLPPLDIAKVRQPAPEDLTCGDFVRETPGFSWFCSRHWAVKTDMPEDAAASVLELLELAWPQYLALFGAEPWNERLRPALVVASSRNALKRAMVSDSMFSFSLGGVTQEGYGCSYLYAGTPYQTRYIVLHEATHLFQYSLTGNTRGCYGFFTEGVADFLSSHVYDPATHTLAVNVLDRAPIHNHLSDGLAEWRAAGEPRFTELYATPTPSRGISVLMTAFLQSSPEYAAKWREFCRSLILHDGLDGKTGKDASDLLLGRLYGGAEALDVSFGAWMRSLSPSYLLARREFDQEGGTFVSCAPAAEDAPAVLEGRMPAAMPGSPPESRDIVFEVGWRETPANGAAARIELLPADGDYAVATCALSKSKTGSFAIFEVDGIRLQTSGARRLHSLLQEGAEIRIAPEGGGKGAAIVLRSGGETLARAAATPETAALLRGNAPIRWRISASQPGIAFTPSAGGSPAFPFPDGGQPPVQSHARAAVPFSVAGAPIRAWTVLGPFSLREGKFGHCRKPLNPAEIDMESVHTLDDGTFVQWRPAAMNVNPAFSATPIANLAATFGRQANDSFALAMGHVECDADTRAVLLLGVSDGAEVFVNGRPVLDDVRRREWQDGNICVPVELRKGRNEILLRLTHGNGVWLLSGGIVF